MKKFCILLFVIILVNLSYAEEPNLLGIKIGDSFETVRKVLMVEKGFSVVKEFSLRDKPQAKRQMFYFPEGFTYLGQKKGQVGIDYFDGKVIEVHLRIHLPYDDKEHFVSRYINKYRGFQKKHTDEYTRNLYDITVDQTRPSYDYEYREYYRYKDSDICFIPRYLGSGDWDWNYNFVLCNSKILRKFWEDKMKDKYSEIDKDI